MSMRPPDQLNGTSVFLSSSSSTDAVGLRDLIETLANKSFNPVLRKYAGGMLVIERWEQENPHRAIDGDSNAEFVEMAKKSHYVCVLVFDWIGPGTIQEVEEALKVRGPGQPKIAVFRFAGDEGRGPIVGYRRRRAMKKRGWIPTRDFFNEHRNDFTWSPTLPPNQLEAIVWLNRLIVEAALHAAQVDTSKGGYHDKF